MIKVTIEKNKIIITGHSNYDIKGKDIVCASVSSIVITTINAIIDIDSTSIEFEDINDVMTIKTIKENDIVNKLINNMIFMLEGLAKDYPKNIKLLRR